ncbi:hypothetical protein B0H13DRAFT_2373310 [Mycena leptocephala]|nr:hypothetical protein B0H13DRAFT_2373310 [Mycena leptocephala]
MTQIMTIDDLPDHDHTDALVGHTKYRPIPRGAVSVKRTWMFFSLQVLVGIYCARAWLSPFAFHVAATICPLYIIYPTCKRWTNFCANPTGFHVQRQGIHGMGLTHSVPRTRTRTAYISTRARASVLILTPPAPPRPAPPSSIRTLIFSSTRAPSSAAARPTTRASTTRAHHAPAGSMTGSPSSRMARHCPNLQSGCAPPSATPCISTPAPPRRPHTLASGGYTRSRVGAAVTPPPPPLCKAFQAHPLVELFPV